MADKGISPVVASILTVLIVIALAGSYLTFTGRLSEQTTGQVEEQAGQVSELAQSQFSIRGVSGREVRIRNLGSETIEVNSFLVTIDNQNVNYTMDGPIGAGETGTLTVEGLWQFGPTRRTLEVTGAVQRDSETVRIKPKEEGLVANWRFEEGGGDTAFDVSDNDNHGTLGGGNSTRMPEWVNGRFEGALEFDGVDDYLTISDTPSLSPDSITVSVWIKYNTLPPAEGMVSKHSTASDSDNWESGWLGFIREKNDLIKWQVRGSDGNWYKATYTPISDHVSTGEWHMFTGVADANNELRLYVDGDMISSGSFGSSVIDNSNPVNLAHRSNLFYEGTVDTFTIFNRAYTPDQLYVMQEV